MRKSFISFTAVLLSFLITPFTHAFEEGSLLIWIGNDKGVNGMQKVGDIFADELGIPVTVEFPEDAPSKFQQAAAVEKGPDIFFWAHDRAGEWVQSGLLHAIEPSAEARESISQIGWDAFTIDGKLYGYPISYEAVALVYNTDLVPEPPADFNDVIALDEKLAAEGKKAILWDYANTYFTWPLLAANGGYVFAQDENGVYDVTDTGVNNEGAVMGASLLNSLIESGVLLRGAGYSDMEAGVNKGNIAMMINGPWSWANLEKSGINYAVAPIPAVNGAPSAPFVGVFGAMISRASPNKDLAIEFIEQYLSKPEYLKMVNDDKPIGVPANNAFFEELAADNEKLKSSKASVDSGSPMPSTPQMGKFWSAMAAALENLSQGRQTPQEALDAAAKRIITE